MAGGHEHATREVSADGTGATEAAGLGGAHEERPAGRVTIRTAPIIRIYPSETQQKRHSRGSDQGW